VQGRFLLIQPLVLTEEHLVFLVLEQFLSILVLLQFLVLYPLDFLDHRHCQVSQVDWELERDWELEGDLELEGDCIEVLLVLPLEFQYLDPHGAINIVEVVRERDFEVVVLDFYAVGEHIHQCIQKHQNHHNHCN